MQQIDKMWHALRLSIYMIIRVRYFFAGPVRPSPVSIVYTDVPSSLSPIPTPQSTRSLLGAEDGLLARRTGLLAAERRLVDHRALGMRRLERAQLDLELLVDHRRACRGRDEPEERRGRVQRARAELGVRLEADKVRVFCAYKQPSALFAAGKQVSRKKN